MENLTSHYESAELRQMMRGENATRCNCTRKPFRGIKLTPHERQFMADYARRERKLGKLSLHKLESVAAYRYA